MQLNTTIRRRLKTVLPVTKILFLVDSVHLDCDAAASYATVLAIQIQSIDSGSVPICVTVTERVKYKHLDHPAAVIYDSLVTYFNDFCFKPYSRYFDYRSGHI